MPIKRKPLIRGRETNDGSEDLPSIVGTPTFPGDQATRPQQGAFQRAPFVKFGGGARSFVADTRELPACV